MTTTKQMLDYLEHIPGWIADDTEMLQAILTRLQSAVVVREGFKVVPRVPTKEMHGAACESDNECNAHNYDGSNATYEEHWQVMLAAAPEYVEE